MSTLLRYTADRVLRAAIASMITGRHTPHCFTAYVIGRGYVNDGSEPSRRADYLDQLQRAADSELENLRYADAYAEVGHEQPRVGIIAADWNVFPTGVDATLEKLGYELEWSDCVDVCEDCNRMVTTEPTDYCWQPYYQFIEESRAYSDPYQSDSVLLCLDCLQDWAEGCRTHELKDLADRVDDAIAAHSNDYLYRDVPIAD